MKKPYTRRDRLAQDRTNLANERTFLAYGRTALAFLALGAFLIKFVPAISFTITGLVSILFGVVIFVYSIVKYIKYKEKINRR